MRRFDKMQNIKNANLLSEQRYIQSKLILTESVLKGMKGKIWNIVKDYYTEPNSGDEDQYSRVNIFRDGDLDDSARLEVVDEEGYFDFPRFERQIERIISDQTVEKVEIQYGDDTKGYVDWLTLYERK